MSKYWPRTYPEPDDIKKKIDSKRGVDKIPRKKRGKSTFSSLLKNLKKKKLGVGD